MNDVFPMSFYPATVVIVDDVKAVVRFEATGHEITFVHEAHNALPSHLRQPGAKGFVSFPKAPPIFTERAA